MGIEQILMPILGGVASGVGRGLEQKRQEQQEIDRQRNAKMAAKFLQDPELFEEPAFRKWAQNYWGKDEAKAMYSAARIKKIQSQYEVEQRRQGIMEPGPIPADQIPPEPQFADFSGGGNPGGIAGLISRFVPGAGAVMNTLGGLVGPGAAQAQMTPQVSSPTGPPSGPQGYPPPGGWQQAAAPATPQAGQVVGYLQSGRPVVQNADGSTSTHRNMIAGFGDKFYIVPTIYGGKEVTPDQAAQIAQQNNLTDPDTGQKLVGYPTQQAAEQEEKSLHAQLEKEPRVPLAATSARVGMDERIGIPVVSKVPTTKIVSMPGGRTSISGITTGGAPSGGRKVTRVNQLAEGVTESIDKDGNSRFTFKKTDPNLSTAMGISQQIRKLEGGSGDLDDPVEFKAVWDGARDIEALQAYDKVRFQTQAESDPDILARRARIESRLTGAKVAATKNAEFAFESRGDVQQLRQEQKFSDAQKTSQGQTAAENSPVVDANGNFLAVDAQGNPLTKNQLDVLKAAQSARQTEQAKVIDPVTQKKLDGLKGMLASVDRIWQNYDPKFLGAVQGTKKALKWREITGLATGPESVMRQTMTALSNIKIQDLTGAGVTYEDGVRILAELPSPQDSPEVFVAKLANFQTMLGEALERAQQGATQPRSAQTPNVGTSPKGPSRREQRPIPQKPAVIPRAPVGGQTPIPGTGGQTPAPPDNTATSAPGEVQRFAIPQSWVGPDGKPTKEARATLTQWMKQGLLPANALPVPIPDEEYNQMQQ